MVAEPVLDDLAHHLCLVLETLGCVLRLAGSTVLPVATACVFDMGGAGFFQSPAVSLRTARFNIQKFYMVLALRCVLCGSENRQRPLCIRH
jgi:hypothetical protein